MAGGWPDKGPSQGNERRTWVGWGRGGGLAFYQTEAETVCRWGGCRAFAQSRQILAPGALGVSCFRTPWQTARKWSGERPLRRPPGTHTLPLPRPVSSAQSPGPQAQPRTRRRFSAQNISAASVQYWSVHQQESEGPFVHSFAQCLPSAHLGSRHALGSRYRAKRSPRPRVPSPEGSRVRSLQSSRRAGE